VGTGAGAVLEEVRRHVCEHDVEGLPEGVGPVGIPQTVHQSASHPRSRRPRAKPASPASGSTQWKAVADTTRSYAASGTSKSSNLETTTSAPRPRVRSVR
jgi:hypothetical protein